MLRLAVPMIMVVVAGCQTQPADESASPSSPETGTAATSQPISIREFRGRYAFLGNDWPSEVEFEGSFYPTASHAIAAARTTDAAERRIIAAQVSPADARRRADAVQLRPDWDRVKFELMEQIVRDKFTRHSALREKLRRTGDAHLENGNADGDRVWGVSNGVGENRLGIILMKVRDEARYGAPGSQATISP